MAVGDASRDVALRCEGLIKRFGDLTAVRGLSFEVQRGECFGLLGPNGAGKTTTMEILEGLTPADGGRVEVLGMQWRGTDPRSLRERLGVQLQQTELPDRLTVLETMRLFRSLYPRGASVDELLALVSLDEKRSARVVTLSGGQKQRLSLACAMAGAPDVLFLDEPTTGLDPQARLAVWSIVERFVQRGGTVLITTHYMDEAERLCQRVAIVDHGAIIALDTPAVLKASIGGQVLELEVELGTLQQDRLAALPGVTRVAGRDRAWTLAISDIALALPALLDALRNAGDRLRALNTHAPTLEDVFVSLTGRALRDV